MDDRSWNEVRQIVDSLGECDVLQACFNLLMTLAVTDLGEVREIRSEVVSIATELSDIFMKHQATNQIVLAVIVTLLGTLIEAEQKEKRELTNATAH